MIEQIQFDDRYGVTEQYAIFKSKSGKHMTSNLYKMMEFVYVYNNKQIANAFEVKPELQILALVPT